MGVRYVRVIVHELGVMVFVAVRLASWVCQPMTMLMVRVMHVNVRVR